MDKLIMNDEVFGSEEMPDGGDVGRVTRRKGDGVLNAERAPSPARDPRGRDAALRPPGMRSQRCHTDASLDAHQR